MPNRLDLPPELEELIEKRQNEQRRQECDGAPIESDRRTGVDRRKQSKDEDPGSATTPDRY